MQILHVIDQISQKIAGGSARVCYQLAAEEAKLGHTVIIYTTDYNLDHDFIPPVNVEVKTFHCVLNFAGGLRLSPGILFNDARDFDMVHLHNYRTAINIAARNFGIPWVLQAQGNANSLRRSCISPLTDGLWNPSIRKASGLIAINDTEVKQYIAEGADRKRISIIPVGIDLSEFNELPSKVNDGVKRIVYLGRLHWNKGIDLLINAFMDSEINKQNTVLQIIGEDDGDKERLESLIDYKKGWHNITFFGGIYGKQKIKMLVDADVVVVPSRYEAWGLTFMEALACGTPVIMTRNCEAANILPSYCGRVVDFDATSLAFAIRDILYREIDGNFWQSSAAQRRDWVKQYGWERLVHRYLEVYAKTIGRGVVN